MVDSTRREPATAERDDRRQITMTVWYPAKPAVKENSAPYMPDFSKYRGVVADETMEIWGRLSSPVQLDARAAGGAFPVLMFSHGWRARSASYSIWLSEVASHGFVVVGVDHPYMGVVATHGPVALEANDEKFPNQKYADLYYADDLAFVRRYLATLNTNDPMLRRTMNLEMIIASGHSSGHGAASAFAALHPGIKGLISFDAGVSVHARERGLSMPLFLVRAENPSYTDIFVRNTGTNPRGTIYDSTLVAKLRGPFYDLHVLGSGHGAVMDDVNGLVGDGRAEIRAHHELIAHYTIAFLQSVVAGDAVIHVRAEDKTKVRLRRVSLEQKK